MKNIFKMCGIFCILSQSASYNLKNLHEICEPNLYRRGPDSKNTLLTVINDWNILLSSSVLWLQGQNIVNQPVETDKSWFLFNGDVLGETVLPFTLRNKDGDTLLLLNEIENSDCISILRKVEGPYAFIYINKKNATLYFGRDIFGRRSLLVGIDDEKIILTSVASRNIGTSLIELPAIGIFSIDLNAEVRSIKLYPWDSNNQHIKNKINQLEETFKVTINYLESKLLNNYSSEIPLEDEIQCFESIEHLKRDIFPQLLNNETWNRNLYTLHELLDKAVKKRVINTPEFCNDCIKLKTLCNHATIAILFSGGLDCAILTLLADKYIKKSRPIDLFNVSFEKSNSYDTPDRLTARQTLNELSKLRPNRLWNLLEINVSQEELQFERSEKIGDLIYPLRTILDESLGCALWFASRGKLKDYISPCRVVLVGMGADELFGGYSRHRGAFKRGSWNELSKELDNDWKNISHRNLARDDRIISDHGRQVRTPYLDENVVTFIRNLKAWERCYPHDNLQGIGDKLLLRILADKLGLQETALLRKRAIQFGSRIANSKENANDISPRL